MKRNRLHINKIKQASSSVTFSGIFFVLPVCVVTLALNGCGTPSSMPSSQCCAINQESNGRESIAGEPSGSPIVKTVSQGDGSKQNELEQSWNTNCQLCEGEPSSDGSNVASTGKPTSVRRSPRVPVLESLSTLPLIGWAFETAQYPRRWNCGEWTPTLGWLHILSDLGIWFAYLLIPVILIYFLRKNKKQVPFRGLFLLFASFILLCGTTHIIEAIIFWVPIYGIAGLVKFVTAIISLATVVALVSVIPQALKFRSPQELEQEVDLRTAQLDAARAQAASIVANSPIGKLILNSNDQIVLTNSAFTRTFEVSEERLMEDVVEKLLPIHERKELFEKSAAENSPIPEQRRMFWKKETGSEIIIEVIHRVLPSEGDKLLLITINDVTEREEGLGAVRRLASIVESSQDEIIGLQLDGTISSWNRGATELYGYTRDEMVGESFAKLYPENGESFVEEILKRLILGEKITQIESERVTKSGESITVVQNIAPIVDSTGEIVGASAMGHNITERKKLEKQRIRLNEELEARVEQRTYELARSNKELEEFAYVASHDLQEPLRKISSYCQLLMEEQGESLDEEGRDYLNVAINGAVRLRTLVRDLLEFSRITTRGKPLAPTCAKECVEAVLSDLEVSIEEKEATVVVPELPEVMADSSQLTRLFQNLIANAIKYQSDHRPHIEIACRELESQYEFSVSDNGIGIAEEYYERVFGIFQRLHNRKEYSGTGIGLALCKRIVERFGGRIWVRSEPSKGSTFYFTLQKVNNEDANDGTRKPTTGTSH